MQVRFVQADAIRSQLDARNIVLLSNIAYSSAGEVLNCDIYSVATRAAIDLQVVASRNNCTSWHSRGSATL